MNKLGDTVEGGQENYYTKNWKRHSLCVKSVSLTNKYFCITTTCSSFNPVLTPKPQKIQLTSHELRRSVDVAVQLRDICARSSHVRDVCQIQDVPCLKAMCQKARNVWPANIHTSDVTYSIIHGVKYL